MDLDLDLSLTKIKQCYFQLLEHKIEASRQGRGLLVARLGVNKCFMHRFSQFNASPGPGWPQTSRLGSQEVSSDQVIPARKK